MEKMGNRRKRKQSVSRGGSDNNEQGEYIYGIGCSGHRGTRCEAHRGAHLISVIV